MKNKNSLFQKINTIYLWTILASIGLILFSRIPYGWKIWENILISIGCSGIAAAIMAIFLDVQTEKKENAKREQLRQVFLAGLNHELKHIFERVLWFDKTLNKIDLSKDVDYYLSLDFIQEAHSAGYYRQTTLKDCEKEIEQVLKRYELKSLQNNNSKTNSKIEKMFLIIGSASMPLLTELDIIKRNQLFLLTNNIFTVEELDDIHVSIGQHVELLKTPSSNYGVALSFLLYGYKKIYELGHFDQDIMIIYWKHSKDPVELLIEKRQRQSSLQTDKSPSEKVKRHKKKGKKKKK